MKFKANNNFSRESKCISEIQKQALNTKNSNAGITLVALVVTIVVLIILAGVSMNLLLGDNGIITKAQEARKVQEIAEITTSIQLGLTERRIGNEGKLTNLDVVEVLNKYGNVNYQEDGITIKSITTEKAYEILASNLISADEIIDKANGSYNFAKHVNAPQILTGMTPIKYEYPTDTAMGQGVETTGADSSWYEYGTTYETKRWANTVTKDDNGEISAYWVWIPRFAYKINKQAQTTDVVFLIGTTDNYYDENGQIQTAQRCLEKTQYVETDSTKTDKYTVHPAFTNESSIDFRNGGWDEELTGIWVAKFEAGYAGGNNDIEVVASEVNYSQTTAWVPDVETGKTNGEGSENARNWLDGVYGSTQTAIKYPTFTGTTYSMNYINHNDSYKISKVLTGKDNIYGLTSSTADSHLMKNSEWGAVTYLSRSKYGLYNTDITVNNANLNSGKVAKTGTEGKTGVDSVYGITGYTSNSTSAGQNVMDATSINTNTANTPTTEGLYTWNQKTGQSASTTGTIYGIYDLSGALWERNASFVSNGSSNLLSYGKALIDEAGVQYSSGVTANTGKSTKYVTIYPNNDSGETDYTEASKKNYSANTLIYGDSVRETSTEGFGTTSWYEDYSGFPAINDVFFVRGGYYWDFSRAGLSFFHRNPGTSHFYGGFRAVLVGV